MVKKLGALATEFEADHPQCAVCILSTRRHLEKYPLLSGEMFASDEIAECAKLVSWEEGRRKLYQFSFEVLRGTICDE